MSKMVVTGGAGFIGSHLCDQLLDQGHEVHVVDDLSTGRLANLAHLESEARLVVHQHSICDFENLKGVMRGSEGVFHLAALADIVPSIENPLSYAEANVRGTFCVLHAAQQASVKRLVYTASSSCYGVCDTYPTPENAPCSPEYPYALTKYLGEQAALHWNRVYGLPVVSLRLFNVYGPRSRTHGTYGAMFGIFLAQKLAKQPFTVVGDGEQSRDFTYVTDVANAFVMAYSSTLSGEVLNVGTGHSVTVNRIVELLGGSKVHIPKRPSEPDCTQADVAKIKRLLSWEARVPIETGVQTMLDNIDYWKEAPVWTPQRISQATASWFKHLGHEHSKDQTPPG